MYQRILVPLEKDGYKVEAILAGGPAGASSAGPVS